MSKKLLLVWSVGTVLLLALLFRLLYQGTKADVQDVASTATALTQPPDVAAAVVISGPTVATAKKQADGTVATVTHYVPPEGSVQVVVKKDGTAAVIIKNKGFCLSPGVYAGGTAGPLGAGGVVGCGAKLAFWGRFGLDAGVVGRPFAAFAGVSYLPPWRFRNTGLILGYTTAAQVFAGCVIRF